METYNSWDELVDKIKFYLQPENDRTRKVVAQKGRTFVMERFSYDNRVREILEVIQ
jgi:spore maturation protein CgeB